MGKELKILATGEWGKNLRTLLQVLQNTGYNPAIYQVLSIESMRVAIELQDWDVVLYGVGGTNIPEAEAEMISNDIGNDIPFINLLRLDSKGVRTEKEILDRSQNLKEEILELVVQEINHKVKPKRNIPGRNKIVQTMGQFGLVGDSENLSWLKEEGSNHQGKDQDIFDYLKDGATILLGNQVEYANQKVLEMFGLDQETYAINLGLDLVDPEMQSQISSRVQEGLEKGDPPEMLEFWINRKDGERHFIQNSYFTLESRGKLPRCLVITTDNTEQWQTEKALMASQNRYRKISELISDYAYAFQVEKDGSFKPEWLTEAFTRLTGFSTPEEIDSFGGLLSMIHQEDQTLAEKNGESLMSGKAVVSEFRIVTKGGEIRWIRDYSQPEWDAKEGRVVKLFGAAQDITQRKEVEEALKESEARNLAILNVIPDWIFRVRRNGRILDFKGGQERFIPGLEKTIAGSSLNEVFDFKTSEMILEKIRLALENEEIQKFDFIWSFPDGARHFEASLVVSGRTEVLMFMHDISARARLEKMKSDFINRASHELRTPLTGAMLMCDLIEEATSEEEHQEYWGHLRNELGRQRSLVERLLTVGRLETGSLKLKPEAMDLIPVLHEAAETVFPIAKTSAILISQEIEENLPGVIGDKDGLEQVFTNLLNNAVKFSPPNSVVKLIAKVKNEGISVQVKDQGVGIPPADIPHLFEGFFRAQNAIEKGIPGSGVGLYIVKSIIEELGGTVEVESKLDEGTTFEVWLPAVSNLSE